MNVPRLILHISLAAIFVAILAHVIVNNVGLTRGSALLGLFDVGVEQNFPTWVSTLFWFSIAASAFTCSLRTASTGIAKVGWLLIAAVFLLASFDEASEMHERIGSALQEIASAAGTQQLPSDASPGSPWIGFLVPIVFAILLMMAAFVYRQLSNKRLFLLLCLGPICFAFAIAMDFYQGMPDQGRLAISSSVGLSRYLAVEISILLEEGLELLGCALITFTFLTHASKSGPTGDERIFASPEA